MSPVPVPVSNCRCLRKSFFKWRCPSAQNRRKRKELTLNDPILQPFLKIYWKTNNFEGISNWSIQTSELIFFLFYNLVYLSKSAEETFKFILSGKRPDCLHILQVSYDEDVFLRIAAAIPKRCIFTLQMWIPLWKYRLPQEMIFKEESSIKVKFNQ